MVEKMDNPGLPDTLWSQLDGRLWHATTASGLSGILSDGEIKSNFGDRYKNSFCRSQGCVCLFDFGPTAVVVTQQFSNWYGWFGHQQNSRIAVWLEIDREKSKGNLIDAAAARTLANGQPYKFIAGVEACHRGHISHSLINGALLIARDRLDHFQYYSNLDVGIFESISTFESELPAEKTNPIIEALNRARLKHSE